MPSAVLPKSLGGPGERLNTQQKTLVAYLIAQGKAKGATTKEILAAIETAAVENNYSNAAGPGPAAGWRQEEPSYGSVSERLNLAKSVDNFYNEVKGVNSSSMTAGELAQSVQRSAYPKRYGEHETEAKEILGTGVTAGGGFLGVGDAVESGVISAAKAVAKPLEWTADLAKVLLFLTERKNWVRVMKVGGGGIIFLLAIKELMKVGGSGEATRVAQPATHTVKHAVTKAAELAAVE